MPVVERHSAQVNAPATAGTAQAPLSLGQQPDTYSGIGNLGKSIENQGQQWGQLFIELENRKKALIDASSTSKARAFMKVARERAQADIEATPDTTQWKKLYDKHYQTAQKEINKLQFTDNTRQAVIDELYGEDQLFRANLDLAEIKQIAKDTEIVKGQELISTIGDFGAGKNTETYGKRPDGTQKGTGWLGELPVKGGGVATEYSMQSDAVKVNGKRIDFPTLVPNLTKEEIELMTSDIIPNNKDIPEPIVQKAIAHAKKQLAQNKSVWANDGVKTKSYPPQVARAIDEYRQAMSSVYTPDIIEVKIDKMLEQGKKLYEEQFNDKFTAMLSQSNFQGAKELLDNSSISDDKKIVLEGSIQKEQIIGLARGKDFIGARSMLERSNLTEDDKRIVSNHIDTLATYTSAVDKEAKEKAMSAAYISAHQEIMTNKDKTNIYAIVDKLVAAGEDGKTAIAFVTNTLNSVLGDMNAIKKQEDADRVERQKLIDESNYAKLRYVVTTDYKDLTPVEVEKMAIALNVIDKVETLQGMLSKYQKEDPHPYIRTINDMYSKGLFGELDDEYSAAEAGIIRNRMIDATELILNSNKTDAEKEQLFKRTILKDVTNNFNWFFGGLSGKFKNINDIQTPESKKKVFSYDLDGDGKVDAKGKYTQGDIVTKEGTTQKYILFEDDKGKILSMPYNEKTPMSSNKANRLRSLGLKDNGNGFYSEDK